MNDLEFRLNGVIAAPADEPYPYLDQAHGVLECVIAVIEAGGVTGPFNQTLVTAALRGASTLIGMAGLGLARMDESRSRART